MNNPNTPVPPPEETVASTETSFADLLSQFEQEHDAPRGQAITGVVIQISEEWVYVDIGRKMEGVLPVAGFRDSSGALKIQKGDQALVMITGTNEEGLYTLSTIRVERPRDWSGLEKAFQEKRTIGGRVVELVKGGLKVDVGVEAFMPASRSGAKDQAALEQMVGQEIHCRIIKLDTAEEDVVVDRRVVLEEEEEAARQRAFDAIQEGAVVKGVVRNVTEFGAFVDLGGVDGLLHVADMSWQRVGKPSDVLKTGDEVEVKVLRVNRDTRKISVGMKQLTPEPWTLVAEKYKVGDRVRGKVVRVADFGAFVELEPGVEGLIHVSEMSWSKKQVKASDIVKAGEMVEAVILKMDPAEKRMALGLKQALGDPWEEAVKKYPAGAVVEAPVTSLQKFGAFVDLGNGIDGMIHIGDITREKRLNHPNEVLSAGQVVKAQVLEIDSARRRIRLGMKQLEPTTVDEYIAEHKPGEVVSGRTVEVSGNRLKVELGEGVYSWCPLPAEGSREVSQTAGAADLSALTAKLTARWKGGASDAAKESVRAGQIRSFRIVALDPAEKKIQIELAD